MIFHILISHLGRSEYPLRRMVFSFKAISWNIHILGQWPIAFSSRLPWLCHTLFLHWPLFPRGNSQLPFWTLQKCKVICPLTVRWFALLLIMIKSEIIAYCFCYLSESTKISLDSISSIFGQEKANTPILIKCSQRSSHVSLLHTNRLHIGIFQLRDPYNRGFSFNLHYQPRDSTHCSPSKGTETRLLWYFFFSKLCWRWELKLLLKLSWWFCESTSFGEILNHSNSIDAQDDFFNLQTCKLRILLITKRT